MAKDKRQRTKNLQVFSTLKRTQRRNLLTLFATGLLFWTSLASLLPTLPLYVNRVGGTPQQIGIVMGAFAIGLLLFRPWLGRIADQKSRTIVLILGTAVAAIAPLGFLFVKSIPLLFLLRAFHGISIAAFTTAYSALVVDLSPINQRGELIGYMSLVQPLGVAIGPAVGGLIQSESGFAALFILAAVLGGASFLGAIQIKEPSKLEIQQNTPITSPESPATDTQFWRLLFSARLRIPALVLLLIGSAFGALSTFIPLYIEETKVNLNAGWFYTAAAIASFSVRLFIGRASDRYGRGLFITASLICYTISMFILSQANSANAFLLGGFIEGAGAGTLLPMMIALISDRSSPQERGRVFALCISGFDLGIAIAGPLLGTFAPQLGYRGIFTISVGLAILALIVFLTQSSKNLRHSLKFAIGQKTDCYAFNK